MEITTARIVNSDPIELVTLSYEVILDNLETSINNVRNNKKINIEVSKALIKDLSLALDMKYEISKKLKNLYIYTNGLLINADITINSDKKIKCLEEAKHILTKIYSSFKIISDNEKNKISVMQNTDTIYSGLTYGINGLNETVVSNSKRGLKA